MNILVTGSNGFIGDHVCRYLKGKGHYIIGLGRKKTVFDSNHVNEYVQCDLSTEEALKIADKVSVRIDAVVHLAADMRKEPHCVGSSQPIVVERKDYWRCVKTRELKFLFNCQVFRSLVIL